MNEQGKHSRIQNFILAVCAGVLLPLAAFGQTPPPNDNYSNRIVLDGTDLTFSGQLAGATTENYRERSSFENTYGGPFVTQSVWWTWTAPTDTVLNLQILSSSLPSTSDSAVDGLVVYQATNGSTSPSGLMLPPLVQLRIDTRIISPTLSIPVSAGSDYQIQLLGSDSATHTIRLLATNAPIIVLQPKSQTVYTNASTFFYVIAEGVSPSTFHYQWFFNGANLPGETAPMLALTNIDDTKAGAYTVAVTNAAGFATVSEPATLAVTQTNVPVYLVAQGIHSNSFVFSVMGELGRSYRLESSTDLVNWISEKDFALTPAFPDSTSVFFNASTPLVLTLTNNTLQKYFRVTPYLVGDPHAEICINNLRQIRAAKILWQRGAFGIPWHFDVPSDSDLLPYLPPHAPPICPDDPYTSFATSYILYDFWVEPTCLVNPSAHLLEDPQ